MLQDLHVHIHIWPLCNAGYCTMGPKMISEVVSFSYIFHDTILSTTPTRATAIVLISESFLLVRHRLRAATFSTFSPLYHRWKKMLLNSINKKSSQNISALTNDWCWDYENDLVKCGRSVAKNCKFKFFWPHCIMVCCASFLACHVSLGHLLLTAFEWDEAATRIMAELSLVRKSIRKLLVFVSVYYFECSTNFNYLFPIHDLNFQSF